MYMPTKAWRRCINCTLGIYEWGANTCPTQPDRKCQGKSATTNARKRERPIADAMLPYGGIPTKRIKLIPGAMPKRAQMQENRIIESNSLPRGNRWDISRTHRGRKQLRRNTKTNKAHPLRTTKTERNHALEQHHRKYIRRQNICADISSKHRTRQQIYYRTKTLSRKAVTQPKQHDVENVKSINVNISTGNANEPTLQETQIKTTNIVQNGENDIRNRYEIKTAWRQEHKQP